MHKDLSGKIGEVSGKIENMNKDMNSNFSIMNEKYENISGSLTELVKEFKDERKK